MEKYRTFWKRLLSAIIDSIIFIPFSYFGIKIEQINNKTILFCWLFLYACLIIFYSVYLNGRYGQTLGKKVMNIIVLDVSESKMIGFKHAFYRDATPFIFYLIGIFFVISTSINNPTYNIDQLNTQYDDFIFYATLVWVIIELLTMLTNPKRRAVHDILAQSVVVDLSR
ncbi:RDD family protein [Chitinophaga defluvii]|uniref:RDD family protein n=1 Tax=Chitinophaga defluvii TaxID=3163343 RepID=A0ABV2T3Y6_9BACT